MKFTKMHGLGNDFVFVNMLDSKIAESVPEDLSALAERVCHRRFGVGGDGLILVLPSDEADFRMRIFNNDGSEPEMCGNGIRCFAKYVRDRGYTLKDKVSVSTLAGIKVVELHCEDNKVESVTVDMGAPILIPGDIPVIWEGDSVIGGEIDIDGTKFKMTCVSMGNPHAVIFVDNINQVDLEGVGPKIETHRVFPRKTNVEFVQVLSESEIRMRVWERGAGVTLACGTGACASTVASILNGKTSRSIDVHLDGGTLSIEWNEKDGHVYMSGPATEVFEGEFYI
jgi:diaminopimelate epimerase